LSFIQHHNGQAGLVYVRTRRDSEDLATWFTQQGFQTAAYHAGLSPEERRGIEQSWLNGPLQFVVCTNAFGMGFNKPDVRWIAHFHVPTLLSEYVQEVGRAGRDGKPAVALSLISETTGWLDPADKQRRRFFEAQMQQQQRTAQHLIHKLPDQGEVTFLVRQNRENAVALSLLHSTGCLEWTDPFHYRITGKAGISRMGQSNTTAGKQMTRYLKTRECRWRFLLQAFGFESDGQHHSCGHCDNCCRRGT
jgi:ATP-dependent DNA helicase RecQ